MMQGLFQILPNTKQKHNNCGSNVIEHDMILSHTDGCMSMDMCCAHAVYLVCASHLCLLMLWKESRTWTCVYTLNLVLTVSNLIDKAGLVVVMEKAKFEFVRHM